MSELSKRIAVAVPAAAVFLFVTWLGGWIFTVVIIILGLLIVNEAAALYWRSGLHPDRYFPYTFALWVMLMPKLPYAPQLGLGIFLVFIVMQMHKRPEESIRSFASTLFCGLYAPLGLLALILTRSMAEGTAGFMLALTLLLMVWGNDVFAYFGGKSFGKHKMAPDISPNKTWEGFASGIVGAFAGFAIAKFLVPVGLPLTVLQALPAVLLVSLFGPVGDLTTSKMKRAVHVKDTSDLLPGHGGFFDRFDALILAAPAFYLYLMGLRLLGYATF